MSQIANLERAILLIQGVGMRDRKKGVAFRVIVLIIVLLSIALLASYFIQPDIPKVDLVDDGGFEQGKRKWLLGDQPAKNVSIVDELSHNGTHSLRIIGGGQGFKQDWTLRAVTPGTHLVFFTLLESVDGRDLPQALFHLYFYLYNNQIRYHIDITVTHENGDPYRESAFDPDPGTLPGGRFSMVQSKWTGELDDKRMKSIKKDWLS